MKQHSSSHLVRRLKVGGLGLGALVVGLGLLALNRYIVSSAAPPPAPASAPASTAPVEDESARSAVPESETTPPGTPDGEPDPDATRRAAAANMASLLLMLSLMCFGVAVVCVGWIVYDIRSSRPVWQTQTRYPRRR